MSYCKNFSYLFACILLYSVLCCSFHLTISRTHPTTVKPVEMKLNIDNLLNELEPIRFSKSNHGQLARALNISDSKLSEFEANNSSDIRQVRIDVLNEWLRQGDDLSWSTIAAAVDKVGSKGLAKRLSGKN